MCISSSRITFVCHRLVQNYSTFYSFSLSVKLRKKSNCVKYYSLTRIHYAYKVITVVITFRHSLNLLTIEYIFSAKIVLVIYYQLFFCYL